MRVFLLVGILMVTSLVTIAQENETQFQTADFSEDPDWSALMQDPDVSFEEIVQLFDELWADRPITKGCGYKPFKRWEQLMRSRLDENGELPTGREIQKMHRQLFKNKSLAGNWQPLGPILDDVTTRDDIRGVGRMNYVAFHPNDPNIIFAGAPAGGLWRSFDAGASWTTNTDDLPTLGVSSIAFDPQNPDIIYCGTGDRDANDSPGMGVMKSIDGGESWFFVNDGIEDLTVGDLAVDPNNSEMVIAATSSGIHRSLDAGLTWQIESNTLNYKEIEFKPGDSQVIYATGGGRFYKSDNNGESWEYINDGISQGSRMVIATTAADPEVVYALRASTTSFLGFYKSTDSGENFEEMSDSPNILNWSASGEGTGGQAWYDLCLTADQIDPNTVYVGGIRMKKSIDGGVTWLDIQNSYLHVDQHWLEINPHTDELYLANDGGMYKYENNFEWIDISEGIVSGQIYKLGQSPHSPVKTMCGFQDNGTSEFTGSVWERRGGGDGFECTYDTEDEEWWYNSLYYGRIYRTGPNLQNQKIAGEDELGINEEGAWSSPFLLSRYDNNTMYLGMKNVWRTTNIKHPIKDSIVWERISFSLGNDNNSNLSSVEESRANQNMIWATKGSRKLYYTTNATDSVSNVVWADRSDQLPWLNLAVTTVETHPTDSATLYIGFNGKVYKSADLAMTWEEWELGLPGAAVNDILYDVQTDEGLYVATDIGVFYKDASMEEFIPFNDGLPIGARATELEIYYGADFSENRLKVSTYGRGLWESDLFDATTYDFPSTAVVRSHEDSYEVFDNFSVDVFFYKNLQNIQADELTADELFIENATVVSLTGGPELFTLELAPENVGEVQIYAPSDIILDQNGLSNFHSDTLKLLYRDYPEPFGIYGPGGVGDQEDLVLWLRADKGLEDESGNETDVQGAAISKWLDQSGNGHEAVQEDISGMPELHVGQEGINGFAALAIDGVDDVLVITDLPSPANPSIFAVAQGTDVNFTEHGWIASSRQPNGYVLHPWKDEPLYHSLLIDAEGAYADGPQQWVVDGGAPHIYGVIYERTDFGQKFETVFDGITIPWNGANIGPREDEALINVNLGRDFDDRFGEGKLAEHFIYGKKIYETHRKLIASYLAIKYGFNIGPTSKYDLSAYNFDVAGIGQEFDHDLHHEAQGTGIVKVNEAVDIENGEYLMWGSNNEALVFSEGGFPIESNRLERTWGYQETGDCGYVNVEIDLSDVENIPANIGLIIESTPFFFVGGNPDFVPLQDLGNGWYGAQVDFWNAGVFTVGTSPSVSTAEIDQVEWSVYPNPSSGLLNMELPLWDAQLTIEVVNVTGQIVHSITTQGGLTELNLSHLANGIYRVNVMDGDFRTSKNVLIQQQ